MAVRAGDVLSLRGHGSFSIQLSMCLFSILPLGHIR